MRALVVDDHDELRRLTAQFLEILGHSTAQARDAEGARQALTADPAIALVVLDLQLGAASGLDLADDLEAARSGLYILFMSGYGREEYRPGQSDPARRRFIEKPFTLHGLETALADLLAAP